MFSCVSFIKNVDWEDGPGSECVGWFYRPSDGATFLLWSVALLADLQVSHLPLEKVDVSFLIFYVSHLWKGDASKSCIVALKPASQGKKSLLIALPADLHICWLMNPFRGSLYYAFIPKVTSHHSVRSVLTGADLGCFQPELSTTKLAVNSLIGQQLSSFQIIWRPNKFEVFCFIASKISWFYWDLFLRQKVLADHSGHVFINQDINYASTPLSSTLIFSFFFKEEESRLWTLSCR